MTANFFHRLGAIIILCWLAVGLAACSNFVKGGDNRHNQPLSGGVVQGLRSMGSSPSEGMVIRIFKEESVLEVWKKTATGTYKHFKSYEICAYSGDLGPKFKEGDRQSPEGFYTITPGLMNPRSSYYLSFNTGFPNKFDRVHGRTGSDLMVHGDCSSRGCYAMTDEGIAEIYALARETFKGGNTSFQLQIFPFRMNTANMARHATSPHMDFWKDIKEGHDYFELTKTPPVWDVCEKQYIFNPASSGALDAAGPCPPSVQNPALSAKLQADEADFANKAAAAQTAAERKAAEELAIKERGAAVSGFFSGFGTMFGGNPGQSPNVAPVISGKPATLPTPVAQRP
ncbi:Murein L,D-transpeptidase YafK [Devosia lucknowensis]|uniref:Murein L,D-transpeptidase YafK n=1 Tax=Devosia lucknowensis TaxID=1096929 RepID=A0A1Y6G999_9HYPH|nr:murein L,D-transpeptidase family protein [Devosia lucknowensis]SMQ86314.1 Murein L,D-transpeptidase YafK [Devosia lucknowensis]